MVTQADEIMSQRAKREYLRKIYDRYRHAGRRYKSQILDEFCHNCDYHRKYALRLLNRPLTQRQSRPGPKVVYTADLKPVLIGIWLASEQLCSRLLKAALPDWLEYRADLATEVKSKLKSMSVATIDRMLRGARAEYRATRRLSKPGSLIKQSIPIRTDNDDIDRPGYLEVDTVAHCGGSLEGDFIWSVTFTDIDSGWTEVRSVWNRSAAGILNHLKYLEVELPFRIVAFDSDNGGEFINHALAEYLGRRRIKFTRARPYRKNDNAHVEQKNWTHVRQLLGYDRLGHPALVDVINALYRQQWCVFQNFFRPTLKLKSKQRVGAKIRKRYGKPQTPFARLLASAHVSEEQKQMLRQRRAQLNPFALKLQLEKALKSLFAIKRQLDQKTKAEGPLFPRQFNALKPTLSGTQEKRPDRLQPARPVERTQRSATSRRSGCAAAEPYPPDVRQKSSLGIDKKAKKVLKPSRPTTTAIVTTIMRQRPQPFARLR